MLSSEDHPGVFTFMVGMIVVVMVAVGLSVVADKHRIFSGGTVELKREISACATQITELSAQTAEQTLLLEGASSNLRKGSNAHRELSAQLETQRQRQAALEKSRLEIRKAITALEGDFSQYRATYRQKSWAAAVGESLGTLTIRGGRAYPLATITRVTDVGLEIRHEHGIARIQAPDLEPKMQDRFQWSDEERRSRLKEEDENLTGKPDKADSEIVDGEEAVAEVIAQPPAPKVNRYQNPNAAEDAEKLRLLRQRVSGWNGKVITLRSERRDAASRASYGTQASVPGSLETWVARSARLGRELLRAQAGLAAAKSELAAVSPHDALLKPLETDP